MSAALLVVTRVRAAAGGVSDDDFRSNEFRGPGGSVQFEPAEDDSMIGVRGCLCYIRHPELMVLGLQMLARILEEAPNPHIMIPLVDAVKLEACHEAVTTALDGWRLPCWRVKPACGGANGLCGVGRVAFRAACGAVSLWGGDRCGCWAVPQKGARDESYRCWSGRVGACGPGVALGGARGGVAGRGG
jgi:hypothetical protein